MSDIFIKVLIGLMMIFGGFSCLYIAISLPAVIIWKLYRVIVKGYKFTD